MKRQVIFFMVAMIGISLLSVCGKKTKEEIFNGDYSVCVIESTQQKNKSILTFYDDALDKVQSTEYALGSMGSWFYPPKILDNYMYVVPQGIGNQKEKTIIFELNLQTGESRQYDMNQQAINGFCISDKYIFSVATWNNVSTITRYDKNSDKIDTLELPEIFIEFMENTPDKLMAFGIAKLESNEYTPTSYLYEIDIETLMLKEEYDITGYGISHEGAVVEGDDLYFTNTTKLGNENEELPNQTMSVFHIESKVFETIQLESYSPSQLAASDGKLFIVHCDLVTGEGKEISVYDIETQETELIQLEHNVCQIAIKSNIVYIIDNEAKLYKYTFRDDKLEFEKQINVQTTEGEDSYFYVSSFFIK